MTHAAPAPVDLEPAHRQWGAYVDVLRANEWAIVEVDPADDCQCYMASRASTSS